ncbi:hypothetical protein M9458_055848 [Cirrhinus mrigala]|uniref:ribonuclease H n=1 Tax=Cirrhinus mrigala TaxID=683832 RepID=A0ABD0MIV4_CIRMR
MKIGEWILHGKPLTRTYGYIRRGVHPLVQISASELLSSETYTEKKKRKKKEDLPTLDRVCQLPNVSTRALQRSEALLHPFPGHSNPKRAIFLAVESLSLVACLSGHAQMDVGHTWPLLTGTISVSRVWALSKPSVSFGAPEEDMMSCVHVELTKTWASPFTWAIHARAPHSSLPSMGGQPGACKLSSALAAKAYGAAGQAASTLHAMAILQVYQAKALKQLHEGSSDSEVMQELRSATDLTKVTERPWSAPLSGVSPLPLPGCPTAGTSTTVPLIPLARQLGAWLALPSPSHWLIRTVRLGYAIQFARRPPKFRGIHFTSVQSDTDASVLRAEIAVLLAKDAIEPVPPAEMKAGFYSPYFIVPKKSGGLRPILDLRELNWSLHRLPFKMLTPKRILSCVRHQDWFAAIDLKDAYFHVSILSRHRPFLRFAFEGRAYQYKVLPFGLSLSPRVFTKLAEGSTVESGHPHPQLSRRLANNSSLSRSVVSATGTWCFGTSATWGFGSTGRRASSPLCRASLFSAQDSGPSHIVPEAPGAYGSRSRCNATRLAPYEAASALATRPNPEMGMAPQYLPGRRYPGVPLSLQPVVRPCLPTGGSALRTGVQACSGQHRCLYDGLGCRLQRASSFGLLDRTSTALACQLPRVASSVSRRFLPLLRHKHVLVCTDNTATVAYINHQGGSPANLESIRRGSGRPVLLPGILPLPALLLPDRGSPRQGRADTRLALGAPQVCLSPSEPPCTDPVQDQGGRGAGSAGCALLAHPNLVCRPHASRDSPSLENSPEAGPSFSEDGHELAPASRPVEPPRVAPGRDAADLTGLPQAVVDTITQARAPSTRQAYARKWGLFVDWCSSRREDPQRCSIGVVLTFLQEGLGRRLSPSTLKVYVAAIAAHHDAVDGSPPGPAGSSIRATRVIRAKIPVIKDSAPVQSLDLTSPFPPSGNEGY